MRARISPKRMRSLPLRIVFYLRVDEKSEEIDAFFILPHFLAADNSLSSVRQQAWCWVVLIETHRTLPLI